MAVERTASDAPAIPVSVRVHLAHAALQAVADEAGADILHVKGPAIDPALLGGRPTSEPPHPEPEPAAVRNRRSSADADVLVRPCHLSHYMDSLRANGWEQVTPLLDQGLVQHSTVWFHPHLGQADLHYRFPGIGLAPEVAFDRFWHGHESASIAHRPCTVPSVTAQRLILLLHAARDSLGKSGDIVRAWGTADPAEREHLHHLATDLRAEVALAAATGHLEEFNDRAEYDLWKLYADGRSTSGGFTKLRALAKAAPEGYEHVRLRVTRHALRAVLRAPERLAASLPRRPTRREIAHAYGRLLRRGTDVFRFGGR